MNVVVRPADPIDAGQPEIPIRAEHAIEIHDELVLERRPGNWRQ